MRNLFCKIWKNSACERGTALIIALLVMGILTAVSLAISALVVREIGVTKMALDAGKAYYAAESGIEIGLLNIKENAPGWEPGGGGDAGGEIVADVSEGQDFTLTLKNKSDSYPYLDGKKYDLDGAGAEAFYDVLELNESVTIPLFTVDEGDVEKSVTEFRVYFYAGFKPGDLKFGNANTAILNGWDILRWKIYGLTKTEPVVTESINDFTAVSVADYGSEEADKMTDAITPSWFGSVKCDIKGGLIGDKIGCSKYVSSNNNDGVPDFDHGFDIYSGTCWPWEAREHYYYDDGEIEAVRYCYSIKEFLTLHNYNYLTLTNLMNPAVFDDQKYDKAYRNQLSRLYFRVEAYDGDLPMEYANLDSVGESGGSKVKLNALKKRGGQLPVFNFALYHTKGE